MSQERCCWTQAKQHGRKSWCREHFVDASSQWETTLHCNVVSHWLGAYTICSLLVWILTLKCMSQSYAVKYQMRVNMTLGVLYLTFVTSDSMKSVKNIKTITNMLTYIYISIFIHSKNKFIQQTFCAIKNPHILKPIMFYTCKTWAWYIIVQRLTLKAWHWCLFCIP